MSSEVRGNSLVWLGSPSMMRCYQKIMINPSLLGISLLVVLYKEYIETLPSKVRFRALLVGNKTNTILHSNGKSLGAESWRDYLHHLQINIFKTSISSCRLICKHLFLLETNRLSCLASMCSFSSGFCAKTPWRSRHIF